MDQIWFEITMPTWIHLTVLHGRIEKKHNRLPWHHLRTWRDRRPPTGEHSSWLFENIEIYSTSRRFVESTSHDFFSVRCIDFISLPIINLFQTSEFGGKTTIRCINPHLRTPTKVDFDVCCIVDFAKINPGIQKKTRLARVQWFLAMLAKSL